MLHRETLIYMTISRSKQLTYSRLIYPLSIEARGCDDLGTSLRSAAHADR